MENICFLNSLLFIQKLQQNKNCFYLVLYMKNIASRLGRRPPRMATVAPRMATVAPRMATSA